MTLKYLLIIDFPKFDPLTAAETALCGNLGPLVEISPNSGLIKKYFFYKALIF
jgi:hypothetical protein